MSPPERSSTQIDGHDHHDKKASVAPEGKKVDMMPGAKEDDVAAAKLTSGALPQEQSEDLIAFDDTPSADDDMAKTSETASPPKGETEQTENPNTESGHVLSASTATLRPISPASKSPATQFLTVTQPEYVDPTPDTPDKSQPPSRSSSTTAHGPRVSTDSYRSLSEDERKPTSGDEQQDDSKSEIQSIMDQFQEGEGPGEEEVMSPRLEIANPMGHPPRMSSLEPLNPTIAQQLQDVQNLRLGSSSPVSIRSKRETPFDLGPPVPPKDGSIRSGRTGHDDTLGSPLSPTISLHRPPPPEPEPEASMPFDFHRFLEQLRNKKADPVARYLKSFLSEFGKKQWMVHEQVKIISDFLAFITTKMASCEVWHDVSDAEFDNAREGMEKLVMNRLYSQTFSPAIPPPQPIPGVKSRKRDGERDMGPGRRGQHQEDVERDDVLAQKISIYGWVKEEHLDIPPVGESGKKFLKLAQQEILKIKSYRAPRDKIICVLNCCKVIFGLLKHSKSDSSADSFMPMLIYVTLHANPEHLVSNVQYILRFRNQEKLGGEAGYYLSSLMGAIQFIESMDRTTLSITDEEFEKNVEAAVSAIAEKHKLESPTLTHAEAFSPTFDPSEPDGISAATRPSLDRIRDDRQERDLSTPRKSTSSYDDGSDYDEKAAIPTLLRSIQKPLSSIGRMFSDEVAIAGTSASASNRDSSQQQQSRLGRRSITADGGVPHSEARATSAARPHAERHLTAQDAAARQASAEAAEAQRLHRAEHATVVETLAGMFPDLDRELISDVVYQKEGRVGLAVDACLALST